jgi:hypothetical protein
VLWTRIFLSSGNKNCTTQRIKAVYFTKVLRFNRFKIGQFFGFYFRQNRSSLLQTLVGDRRQNVWTKYVTAWYISAVIIITVIQRLWSIRATNSSTYKFLKVTQHKS